jgi:hypothetical protein
MPHHENRLSRLFVRRMLAAEPAVFFLFDPARMLLLVLGGRVIPLFAVGAFKYDIVSHGSVSIRR